MRLRLLLSFVLVVLVSIVTVVAVARVSAQNEVGRFMISGGMAELDDLVTALESYYQQSGSWTGVERFFQRTNEGRSGNGFGGPGMGQGMGMMSQHLRLADAQRNIIYDSLSLQEGQKLTNTEAGSAITLKNGIRTVGYLLAEGGMGMNRGDQARLVDRLTYAAVTAGLIAGGVALFLAFLLSHRLLRPVEALTSATKGMAGGDLSQRVQVQGSDELAQLGNTFNQMAASLQQAEEMRRALTADIAHELRNPLAIQRANLEAMQDGIYPLTAENLQAILAQNLLLSRLVEDLRTLALAEGGQLRLEKVPSDLTRIAQGVLQRHQPEASNRHTELSFVQSDELPLLEIDPQRFEQILNNLLSNALRYTPTGGKIILSVELTTPQAVRVSVRDSGPGIPIDSLPHVFERFYRADKSRSRNEGGTGLGLAIARQLAEAHGGNLTAGNHPAGGALFTLTLPVSPGTPEKPKGREAFR